MNRGRLVLIAGGVVVVIIMAALTWYGLQGNRQSVDQGVSYTDSISGETFTAFTATSKAQEDGHADTPPQNQITITGLDDFFGDLDQEQTPSILTDITEFVRARVGPHGAKAGALNAAVKKISDNPITYQFTLVVLEPASRYTVTIAMPINTATTPQVTFQGITP